MLNIKAALMVGRTVNGSGGVSSSAESEPPSFTYWQINKTFLQPGVCVCVGGRGGGTAVHGAGQQLRTRGDGDGGGAYVETAVTTPLPHMTQLSAKTTHWAFPHSLSISLLSESTRQQRHVYCALYNKQEPPLPAAQL